MISIKAGTNRLVIIFSDMVIKIPYSIRGIKANFQEFENSKNKSYVANTKKWWIFNIQEKLTDILIIPLNTTFENLPIEIKHLWKYRLHNRIQVGKSKSGKYKFFDYEDIKFKYNKK